MDYSRDQFIQGGQQEQKCLAGTSVFVFIELLGRADYTVGSLHNAPYQVRVCVCVGGWRAVMVQLCRRHKNKIRTAWVLQYALQHRTHIVPLWVGIHRLQALCASSSTTRRRILVLTMLILDNQRFYTKLIRSFICCKQ